MSEPLNDNKQRRFPKPITTDEQVADIAARDALDPNYRFAGMTTYVLSEKKTYKLVADNTDDLSDNALWEIDGGVAPDLTNYTTTDGLKPFTGIQKGINPVEGDDLTTKQWVEAQFTGQVAVGDWTNVTQIPLDTAYRIAAGKDGSGNSVWIISTFTNILWRSIDNGATFSNVNASSGSHTFVAFGNGVFLAAGSVDNGGTMEEHILRSTDYGLTWTPITLVAGTELASFLHYANGVWIGIINDTNFEGVIIRSDDDGLTWTYPDSPNTIAFGANAVLYGFGLWVVIPWYSTEIYVSTDEGLTWTNTPNSINAAGWVNQAFGNGVMVCISENENKLMTSVDGYTWVESTVPGSTTLSSIEYGGGVFVLIGQNPGTTSWYSFNGVDWIEIDASANISRDWIAFSNGRFMSSTAFQISYMDLSYNVSFVKDDGSVPFQNPQQGVEGVAPNDLTILSQIPAAAGVENYVRKDGTTPFEGIQQGVDPEEPTDLVTYRVLDGAFTLGIGTLRTVPIDCNQKIHYGNGVLIVVNEFPSTSARALARSNDNGITWTFPTVPDQRLRDVKYGNGVWIAVSYQGNLQQVLKSVDDGQTWVLKNDAVGGNWWKCLEYGDYLGGRWVAMAQFNGDLQSMWSDDDGETWTLGAAVPENAEWENISYGNGVFIAACSYTFPETNNLIRSTDGGETWTQLTNPTGAGWIDVTHVTGNIWIAVNNGGYGVANDVLRSTDNGATWTPLSSGSANTNYWASVQHLDGYIVAFPNGTGTIAMYSDDDGLTWNDITIPNFYHDGSHGSTIGPGFFLASGLSKPSDTPALLKIPILSLSGYVKKDGSTPITGPQAGVPATAPEHFVTKAQLDALGGGTVILLVEYTADGFTSTGAGPYTTVLPDSFVTAGSTITPDYTGSDVKGILYINGLLIKQADWSVANDGGGGQELTVSTSYAILSSDEFTLITHLK